MLPSYHQLLGAIESCSRQLVLTPLLPNRTRQLLQRRRTTCKSSRITSSYVIWVCSKSDNRKPTQAHRLSSYSTTSPPSSRPESTASLAALAPSSSRYTDLPTTHQPYQEEYTNPYTDDAAASKSDPEMVPMVMASTGRYGTRLGSNPNLAAHQPIPSETFFPQSSPAGNYNIDPAAAGRRKRNKFLIIGGVLLGIAALTGIIAGVVVSQLNKNKSNGSSSSSSATNSGNTTLSNPSDPSVFTKDSRLKQSFWGFAYTPNVSLCSPVEGDGSLKDEY